METFTNSVILPENLPEVNGKEFTGLNRKYLRILMVRIIIFFLFMAGGLAAILILNEGIPHKLVGMSGGAAIILISAISFTITMLGFPRKGYLVREQDISFQKGLITYKLTTVPFNRIQHVEVNQGVLSKLLGLSSVKIYTAGGSYSDLSIPGLPTTDAQ
ncbi:MAG: PH domain-containing protein, partial [Prolixibacteraceae bacterium]|nr:PH domain-containing protein [Prolixibacteraceae bacterium]